MLKRRRESEMSWWYLYLMAAIQSAAQSVFLVYYFRGRYRLAKWLCLVSLFTLVLFPIDQIFLRTDILLKNVVNITVLFIVCHLLFRNESWKTILTGILLYEIILICTEFICVSLIYLLSGMPPDFSADSVSLPYFYILGSIVIIILTMIMLHLFPRGLTASERINSFLILLLINLILTVLVWILTSVPEYFKNFTVSFVPAAIILAFLNIYTVISLVLFAHSESRNQAAARIESAYLSQVDAYLRMEEEEQNIHRLRHDLINFVQTSDSDPERRQSRLNK